MKKKKKFNPEAFDTFIDSVELVFDTEKGMYNGVTIYDGTDKKKSYATVTDAKKAKAKSLIVVIEATHEGKTKNFTEYVADKMEKSAPTWTSPFKKPVLKNHDSYRGEPIGRVIKQEFGESLNFPGTKTIFLTMKITDKDAIEKFLDGRYSTVSIGARVKEITCQLCGRDILKDGFCGHWAGDKYKRKATADEPEQTVVCYWTLGECEYYEVSVVNTPADPKQTGPVQMKEQEENQNDDDEENDNNNEDSEQTKLDELQNFLDSVDDEKDTEDEEDSDNESEDEDDEENSDDESNDEESDDEPNDEPEEENQEENAEKILHLEKQLNEANKKIELYQTDISTLQIDNEKLTKENEELNDKNSTLSSQLKIRTDQTLKLSRQFRDTMINSISSLGKKTDLVVYAERTITDIKKDFDALIYAKSKEIPKTPSPGLANNNVDGVDNEVSKKTEKKVLQDYVNKII